MVTQAVLDLARIIEQRGWTLAQAELELQLAPGGGLLTKILQDVRKPGRHLAFRIEQRLGIPMSQWEKTVRGSPPRKRRVADTGRAA